MVVGHQRRMRRRILQTATVVLLFIAKVIALDWGDTTSSTTFYYPHEAEVGEIVTIVIGPKDRAVVEFSGNSSDHFSVSYRQCSSDAPQPIQFQYGGILQHTASVGGCIHVQNEESDLGIDGCTFWQYNPSETWLTNGFLHENSKLLDPGSVRLENRGSSNATVDVVLFSNEITPPQGIIDHRVWIEDESVKLNRVINTSVNVYFNKVDSYCDSYTCLVSGWVNEYIEGQDSPSLCEVKETGELWYEDELFDNPVSLEFDIPADNKEYYITLILTARESRLTSMTISVMQEYGLDEVVIFQTDTTQPDSGGQQLLTSSWLVVLNMLLASAGAYAALWCGTQFPPTFGW